MLMYRGCPESRVSSRLKSTGVSLSVKLGLESCVVTSKCVGRPVSLVRSIFRDAAAAGGTIRREGRRRLGQSVERGREAGEGGKKSRRCIDLSIAARIRYTVLI